MSEESGEEAWEVDEIHHSGQDSFRIRSGSVTYVYHREGAAFASLLDRDGKEWIGYQPGGGPRGEYRGIPNMADNAFSHPGFRSGCVTELEQHTPGHVRLISTSPDGAWRARWDIHHWGAVQTMERAAGAYWWLYEGTPGGHFNPDTQFRLYPDGQRVSCRMRDIRRGRGPRWVAFCDPLTDRMIVVATYSEASVMDCYRPMGGDGGMTVWGFGRDERWRIRRHPMYQKAGSVFSFALIDGVGRERAAVHFDKVRTSLA